ncbi:MAG: hypothetical protein IIA03_09220, partial [Proteobacteria bacterium]|nr:hypothetical protein [Pseudomonadota bacterium]
WVQRLAQQERGGELSQALEGAQPNPGHLAMAEMERLGFLKHIITQNIDNLHQLAGSKAITEIHGNRTKMRCIQCSRRWPREEFRSDEVPPRCPDCAGFVKGDTVWFSTLEQQTRALGRVLALVRVDLQHLDVGAGREVLMDPQAGRALLSVDKHLERHCRCSAR